LTHHELYGGSAGIARDEVGLMTDEPWSWESNEVIPTDTGAGKRVLDALLAKLAELDWPQQEVFGVHLSVEEALVNAIRHGNKMDATKKVRVCCKLSPSVLRVEVADEGAGFNPADVPDPTAPENLEVPSGRGIMLMRNFMTRVEYNAKGNQVTMEKRRAC
jgi:serine/threonine-protein kinase RsbW